MNNGTLNLLLSPEQKKLISIDSHLSFAVEGPLTLDSPNVDLLMTYEGSKITNDDVDQWILIEYDDFQGGSFGWSQNKLSTCGFNDNMFLGGYCNLGGEYVYKNYTGLPPHSYIRITANFHFFDKWEGEEAFMYFDDVPVWRDHYKWCDKVMMWYCKKYAINACGNEYPDRLSVPIDYISKFILTF